MTTTIGGRGTAGPGGPVRGTGANVSQREDLANFITMITRDETPFLSSIGKAKAKAIYHEWQTDELNTPGDSRIGEGQDYVAPDGSGLADVSPTVSPVVGATFAVGGATRTRLGNYTQINGKTIAVSGTRRAVDQAGVADEYAYQLKKRGTEMRRDIEHDIVNTGNVSNAAGTSGNPNARTMGGYQAFINDSSTVSFAGTGSSVTAGSSDGTGVVTLANQADRGALALSDVDAIMQGIYEEGGKASKIMVSPKLRRDFSDLMQTETNVRRNIDADGTLRQSVDIYMSDFGELMVVPNYIMGLNAPAVGAFGGGAGNAANWGNSSALIYDPMWFAVATLRPMQEVEVGQKGDSTAGMFVEECTLEVKNPKGCGAIYNLV